jgi:hypothetical protein
MFLGTLVLQPAAISLRKHRDAAVVWICAGVVFGHVCRSRRTALSRSLSSPPTPRPDRWPFLASVVSQGAVRQALQVMPSGSGPAKPLRECLL